MVAKRLFVLGALAFWGPELCLYAGEHKELSREFVTLLLPASLLLAYVSVSLVRYRDRDALSRPSAAVFTLLGVLFLGTLAMAIGSTIPGAGFYQHPGTTLLLCCSEP